jgi:hypothetical protein
MRATILSLALGTGLWSYAGWASQPRELWDVPAFWPVWGLAILAAGSLTVLRGARPLHVTAAMFLPILAVLLVTGIAAGRGLGLLPLGLLAVGVLALPALLLSALVARLRR